MHSLTSSTRRAAIHTLGCRLNQSESVILSEQLQAAGYEIVPFDETADLGIVNTCTVTREADAKSRKAIRNFVRRNPQAFVAVIGCYSQMDSGLLSQIEGVDLIIGNQEKLNLLEYIGPTKNDSALIVRDQIQRDDFTIQTAGLDTLHRRMNLKIQDGCDFMCTFCIIPFARGRARSRQFADLYREANELVDRGAKELVLTGVNIGTYDYDGMHVADVVDKLNDIAGLERIRISSIEPTTVPHDLFAMMADDSHALVPYLHLPLQSGSNTVLKRMKRLYTREEYLDELQAAVEAVPGIGLGSDIMVGMTGETDDEFEETRDLLERSPLHYAHVFKYSDREGAAAARHTDKVDPTTKNRRGAVIRHLSAQKLQGLHNEHVGRGHSVLFEQQEGAYWTGYTENYIRVATRSDAILENTVHRVVIDETCGDFVLASLADAEVVKQSATL